MAASDRAAGPLADFESHLAREILQSERTRLAILAGLFALLSVVFPVFVHVFREHYERNFGSLAMMRYALGVTAALVCYVLLVRGVLGRQLARGRRQPAPLRFWNALVETSVPTVLMVVLSRYTEPVLVLQGPAVLLYGIFIVLSTLRLDFALSVFTGLVAAAEFVALSFAHAGGGAPGWPALLWAPGYILMKGVMLLLSGVAAGFVAAQLRRRIVNAFHASQERQRIVSAFGQQVSPQVVEELLRHGADIPSRRSFVCVMFMDIRDFTRLTARSTPEEIVAYQNAVFGAAVEAVNRHHGVINQFLGDGFMATFGAPVATGRECRDAVGAARDLLERLEDLAGRGRIPPTRVGFGLHAGEAVHGNIGSAARQQYSITGEVVILASRIEQLNKEHGSRILVSAEVLKASGDAGTGAVSLGAVRVRGREEPLEIYRLA